MMEESMEYVNLTNADVPADETRSQDQAQGQGGSVLYMPGPGEAGSQQQQQYITIIQDGQTYAIPAADYNAMMAQQGVAPPSSGASSSVSGDPVVTNKDSVPGVEVASISSSGAAPVVQGITQSDENKSAQKKETKVLTPIKPATYGKAMKNIQPAPASLSSPIKKQNVFSGEASQRKHLYPTIQEVIQNLPQQSETPKRNYKPIRVDNWGIFLLSRLQTYFQKKEYCDLTLRFPTKNAQIKVHKLILNACTDFFSQFEKEGKVKDNAIDMPANFTPETVAPIIRFMYTGKIELKESVYEKLRETAETLQMGVLTKLMDAQVNAAPDTENTNSKKSIKRKSNHDAFEEDPVEQMRKIRRIEKRVVLEGKRASLKQELGPKLPGKKLPIWKRKINTEVQTKEVVSNNDDVSKKSQTNDEVQTYKIPKTGGSSDHQGVRDMMNQTIENSREEDDEGTSHIKIEPESGQLLASPIVGVTYQRRSPGEKPKIPRRVQEIQQHLMFEKVLKSGTKNNVVKKDLKDVNSKDLSIDEVKELMQEQKQRLATNAPDEDDEDLDEYDYNNDTLGIGDDYIDNIDSPAPLNYQVEEESTLAVEPLPEPEPQKQDANSQDQENNDIKQQQDHSQVDVNNMQSKLIKSNESTIQDFKPSVAKKTQVEIASTRTELDDALEEFSRVAEEEAEELKQSDESFISLQPVPQPPKANKDAKPLMFDPKKPRRGRPPRWLKEQTLQMGARIRTKQMGAEGSIDLNKSQTIKPPPTEDVEDSQPDENQTQLVNEVFKKYPDLFKSNKAVKVKILTKDPSGKTVTKFITLKSQSDTAAKAPVDSFPSRAESPLPMVVGGFKPVQKVMYTGKRGRPKKVKPGEYDPHLEERKKIEARLKRDYPQLASQLTSRNDIDLVGALMDGGNSDIPISPEDDFTASEQINSSNSEAQPNPSPLEEGSPESNSVEPSNSGEIKNAQSPEIGGGIPQYQPGQTFVMDPSQIQLLCGGGQTLSLDPNQQPQDLIQLLSADGQIQFAVPKSKLTGGNISLPVQSLGVINTQQALINTPGVVGISGQQVMAVGLSPMASLPPTQASLVMPSGVMTLAPVQNYTQNAVGSRPTNMIPVSSELIQPETFTTPTTPQTFTTPVTSINTETSPRVVHKIVSDWDSDEENQ